MKKISVLLLIIMVSAPVFSAPGYEEAMARIGGKPRTYDVSESQAYFQELERKYFEKYKGKDHSGKDYDREVTVPMLNFYAEEQRQCKPGFNYELIKNSPCRKKNK